MNKGSTTSPSVRIAAAAIVAAGAGAPRSARLAVDVAVPPRHGRLFLFADDNLRHIGILQHAGAPDEDTRLARREVEAEIGRERSVRSLEDESGAVALVAARDIIAQRPDALTVSRR